MNIFDKPGTAPFDFKFHEGDLTHSFVMGSTRQGMSPYSASANQTLVDQVAQGGKVVVFDKGSSANEAFDVPAFLRNQKNLMAEIAELRAKNISDHEIAIAVGIPKDSPLLLK